MHRVLLHQADTYAIYCRPVSRGETRVAVLVRDQTNHESMCRDQDAELKGVARSGQYLDFRPKSLGCKQTASRHFSLEATACGPEAGPGPDQNTTAKHRWAPNRVINATDELGRCRPVACINCTMTGAAGGYIPERRGCFPSPAQRNGRLGANVLWGQGIVERGETVGRLSGLCLFQ